MLRSSHWMILFVLFTALALSGCTEENSTAGENRPGENWINEDAQFADAEADAEPAQERDAAPRDEDVPGAVDVAPAPDDADQNPDVADLDVADLDVADESDGAADAIDQDAAPIEDTSDEEDAGVTLGEDCELNAECNTGQVCCATGFGGDTECTLAEDCQYGGTCEDDSECADGEGCCGLQGSQVCSVYCGGSGNEGSGDDCTSNSDCSNDEICCSDGSDTFCTTRDDCQSGGICERQNECQSDETCCEVPTLNEDRCVDRNLCP